MIEALRRHVESLPPGGAGWLAGLNDRYVGAALAMVHGRPGEHWTVERLARQVGLSRAHGVKPGFVVLKGSQQNGYTADLDEILRTLDLADAP